MKIFLVKLVEKCCTKSQIWLGSEIKFYENIFGDTNFLFLLNEYIFFSCLLHYWSMYLPNLISLSMHL